MDAVIEYPKTENLFKRDPETHKLIVGDLRVPEFGIVGAWHVTEKIDGTNMRLIYDPLEETLKVRGRSDRAQVPPDLQHYMLTLAPIEAFQRVFDEFIMSRQGNLDAVVTIYGEGYGAGIQKGGSYCPEKRFRAFDVLYSWPISGGYRHSWTHPSTTTMLLGMLGIPQAPVVAEGAPLEDVIDLVVAYQRGFLLSATAYHDSSSDCSPEGLVARTDPYLYNEKGERVMFKLKVKDLP